MRDELKTEALYEANRWHRRLWALERTGKLSRRQALEKLALAALGGAAVCAGLGSTRRAFAQEALPSIVKPTPEESFRILNTNRETLFEAFKGQGYLTPSSLFFVRNHTRTPSIDAS